MSIRKATGSDGIPARVWKENATFFTPALTMLINDILENGIYPDILKIASIKPIHKSGSRTNVDSYRAISLLPTIDKVIEKILYEQFFWIYQKPLTALIMTCYSLNWKIWELGASHCN